MAFLKTFFSRLLSSRRASPRGFTLRVTSLTKSLRRVITPIKAGLGLLILSSYLAAMSMICLIAASARSLPSVETFWERSRPISVQFLDRFGRDLTLRGAEDAPAVRLAELPPVIAQALIATEDRRYYRHAGLDPHALARAAVKNFKAGHIVQGGSTLSQQLAKNIFLTHEQTAQRKIQEVLLTLWIERSFSKDEILEKYLSRVYFGGQAWGLEAAAQQYFHKSAQKLNLAEAAMMVGLLKAPSNYNPISSPERSGKRAALVLALMEDKGFISREQRRQALTEPVEVWQMNGKGSVNYFVDWLWPQIEAKIGTPQTDIVVRTTLDIDTQSWATAAGAKNLDGARNASQLAIVTLAGDGSVRAMIGGASYAESEFNRAVQARRQPGSAFKPFIYLAAFNAGLAPWDIRDDVEVTIEDWAPRNFSKRFSGPVTLESAFARSVNTVAVILYEEVGRALVIDTARQMGLDGLLPLPSLALGAQAVSPLELTAAYLPFANWGDKAEPFGIISISTAAGLPLYDHPRNPREKLISSDALGHINRIMKAAINQGTGRRAQIKGQDVAGKTGTTNDYRDAWFVGYVQDLVTGVWIGADDNTPMLDVTGGSIPAQIWHDMMEMVLKDSPRRALPVSKAPRRVEMNSQLDIILKKAETALPN